MNSNSLTLHLSNSQDISLIFTILQHLEKRSGYHFKAMHLALSELIENILHHAYPTQQNVSIDLRVTLTLKACQLHVSVQEFGAPFDFTPYLSEAIDQHSDHSKGFYLIYDLLDTFYFSNLGKEGKRFTLISKFSNCQLQTTSELTITAHQPKHIDDITIRTYQPSDEEAISQLIYQNYDYTYYKALFYKPSAVRDANQSETIYSFVAIDHDKIIGHFALIPRSASNCGEVAVAIVHPGYKGIGVMNKMFNTLINAAQQLQFRSIFGEAIMLHPYSQKANLKKGMKESAIVLGLVPGNIEIEHRLKIGQRSGVLLGYRLFNTRHYAINIPALYAQQIAKTYDQFELMLTPAPKNDTREAITTYLDRELELSTIKIERDVEQEEIIAVIERMMLEQSAMLYLDLNLHHINKMDEMVALLNRHGFFYSGIMFDFYYSEDYLRLQKVTSKQIDTQHLVTYSPFGKALLDFIREDQKRISSF